MGRKHACSNVVLIPQTMRIIKLDEYFLWFWFLSLILMSCSKSVGSDELEVIQYNSIPTIEESHNSKRVLPQDLEYGKVLAPVFPDSMKIEQNLLRQIDTYNSAMLHGDVNTCGKYLYPDAFDYCRKYYPDFSDEEVMKEFFKNISAEMLNALNICSKNGIDFEIVVYNLERKIKYKDDVIIVFNVTSNLCSNDVYTHYTNLDKTIGISYNRGTNFWFMNNHDDLPTILSMHYPQKVVNAVIEY